MSDELDFHVAMRAAELTRAGWDPAEAREEARRRLGDVEAIAAECRRTARRRDRRFACRRLLSELRDDGRQALRQFTHARGFAIVAAIILGMGIGASTAMFSTVDAVLLRRLPFDAPDRLVALPGVTLPYEDAGSDAERDERRPPHIGDIDELADVYSHAAAYASGGLNLTAPGPPTRLRVGVVTTSFFDALGTSPARGRGFGQDDGRPDAAPVALLSHRLWSERFRDASIPGASIELDRRAYRVIGVMPPGFTFPQSSDVWIPMSVPNTAATLRPFRGYVPARVIARLEDGVRHDAAAARTLALWERLATGSVGPRSRHLDEAVADRRAAGAVWSLRDALSQPRRATLLALLAATGIVLLIACANLATLLLARAHAREREIAVRRVLGAWSGRLVRQLLTESAVVAFVGAALGLAMAPALLDATAALMPAALLDVASPRIDLRALAFAGVASIACAVAFGLWPAVSLARGGRATGVGSADGRVTAGGGRTPRALVAGQLSLAVVLTIGAGLMLRSLGHLLDRELGFRPENVATLELSNARTDAVHEILSRLEESAATEMAGAVSDLPLGGETGVSYLVTPLEDSEPASSGEGEVERGVAPADPKLTYARAFRSTGGYFRAMGISFSSGRAFTPSEESGREPVAVIDGRMARELWGDADPIGRRFRIGSRRGTAYRVVGVVNGVRETAEQAARAQMYLPLSTAERQGHLAIAVRAALPPDSLLERVRRVIRTVDPAQAVFNERTMGAVRAGAVTTRRTTTALILGFAALALLLSALGLYGVVSHSVSRRVPELGVRTALGATRRDLTGLLTREMIRVAALAVALGAAAAWAGAGLIGPHLVGVGPRDPWSFIGAAALTGALACATTLVAAQRSCRLDPMEALRAD